MPQVRKMSFAGAFIGVQSPDTGVKSADTGVKSPDIGEKSRHFPKIPEYDVSVWLIELT
jgi:hypothetical protein